MKNCKHCNEILPEGKRGYVCTTCKNGLDRYNMTRLDMIHLHESQGGKCALCSKSVKLFSRRCTDSAYIDHSHADGRVRSILCHPCNTALGYLERVLDIDKVRDYLRPRSSAGSEQVRPKDKVGSSNLSEVTTVA